MVKKRVRPVGYDLEGKRFFEVPWTAMVTEDRCWASCAPARTREGVRYVRQCLEPATHDVDGHRVCTKHKITRDRNGRLDFFPPEDAVARDAATC